MNNNRKILLAIFAGAATGVVLGILFSPEKGYETRSKINKSAKKIADNLRKIAESRVKSNGKAVI